MSSPFEDIVEYLRSVGFTDSTPVSPTEQYVKLSTGQGTIEFGWDRAALQPFSGVYPTPPRFYLWSGLGRRRAHAYVVHVVNVDEARLFLTGLGIVPSEGGH